MKKLLTVIALILLLALIYDYLRLSYEKGGSHADCDCEEVVSGMIAPTEMAQTIDRQAKICEDRLNYLRSTSKDCLNSSHVNYQEYESAYDKGFYDGSKSLTNEQLETYCFGLGAKEFFDNGNMIKTNIYAECLDEFNL